MKAGIPPTGVSDNGFFNDSAEIYGGYTTVDKNQVLNMFVNSYFLPANIIRDH